MLKRICQHASIQPWTVTLRADSAASKSARSARRRLLETWAGSNKQPLNELNAAPFQSPHAEDAGRLLDEYIGPGLQLMEQEIQLEGRDLLLIVPRSSDDVMDYHINAEQSDRDPYWCRAWPSAIALGQFLLQGPELIRERRVCEVGAGLGIAGIAAALAGAQEVVLTDREPLALECACRTAQRSGLQAVNSMEGGNVQENATTSKAQVQGRLLDWKAVEPGIGKFDVVLACDVLYEQQAVEPVASLVPELLSSRGGRFLLADPESRTRAHRQKFVQLLVENKKHPMCVENSLTLTVNMDNLSTVIQILVFRSNLFHDTIGVKCT